MKLGRSKSHLHVEKHEERRYLKPLEEAFNLAGFFPPEGGRWRWMGEEAIGEEMGAEEAILEEDKLGILSLFSWGSESEPVLLSPYTVEAAADWEAVYLDLTGRRRRAVGDAGGN